MSKADKMFEKLGFDKVDEGVMLIYVNESKENVVEVCFVLPFHEYGIRGNGNFVKKELHLAIHEKMKELGWLDVD